jgi:hypothetical protein
MLLPAVIAPLAVVLLLIVSVVVAAPLLLQPAIALQTGHRHPAGQAADEVLHILGAPPDKALPAIVGLKALGGIGDSHAGKTPLPAIGSHEVARAAGDTAPDRATSEHAARRPTPRRAKSTRAEASVTATGPQSAASKAIAPGRAEATAAEAAVAETTGAKPGVALAKPAAAIALLCPGGSR